MPSSSSTSPTSPAAAAAVPAPVDPELRVTRVLFTMQWRLMSQILLALPVVGMFICLITSIIFHSDHINNTICKVYNFLPSISAVTGVSPQRYLWRVAVALHISPRLLVAWVGRAYYTGLAPYVPAARRPAYLTLVTAAFYLNLTELATLCGVTYISNKENYPVHEKLFTLFMLVSLVYMLCVIRVVRAVRHTLSPRLLRSFSQKKWIFGIKLASTGGLLFFFWRHRVFCQPMAFSWFSLCEYVIATCNMLYHVSVALDFSDEQLIVGHINATTPSASSNSLSTSSSSRQHSLSSPTTTFESLAHCEGGNESPLARNGRLDDQMLLDNAVPPAGPHPSVQPSGLAVAHQVIGGGKPIGIDKNEASLGMVPTATGAAAGVPPAGCGSIGVPEAGGGGGVGVTEPDSAPAIVHQVLNTIHEGAEPLASQPCLNGPAEPDAAGLVHRRLVLEGSNPQQEQSQSLSGDSQPVKHAHSE